MRHGFGGLWLREAIIHCPVEVVGNLRDLTGRNERADRDQTSVARRKVWPEPQITKQKVRGVRHDGGSDCAELLAYARCALRFGCFVLREKAGDAGGS